MSIAIYIKRGFRNILGRSIPFSENEIIKADFSLNSGLIGLQD